MQVTGHHRPGKTEGQIGGGLHAHLLAEVEREKEKEPTWDQEGSQFNLPDNVDYSILLFPHTDHNLFRFFPLCVFFHCANEPVFCYLSSLLLLQCKTVGVCLRWRDQIHLCEIFWVPAIAKGKPCPPVIRRVSSGRMRFPLCGVHV